MYLMPSFLDFCGNTHFIHHDIVAYKLQEPVLLGLRKALSDRLKNCFVLQHLGKVMEPQLQSGGSMVLNARG